MSKTPIRDLLRNAFRAGDDKVISWEPYENWEEAHEAEITALENRLDAEYITEYLIDQQMREAMEAVAKWVVEHDWGGDWPTMRSVIDKYLAERGKHD